MAISFYPGKKKIVVSEAAQRSGQRQVTLIDRWWCWWWRAVNDRQTDRDIRGIRKNHRNERINQKKKKKKKKKRKKRTRDTREPQYRIISIHVHEEERGREREGDNQQSGWDESSTQPVKAQKVGLDIFITDSEEILYLLAYIKYHIVIG